jgi:hypothetical protein
MTWRIRCSPARVLVSMPYQSRIPSSTILVLAYHGAICDQAHEGIWGQQAQAHNDRVLQRLQAILFLACVDDEQEDGRRPRGGGETILDGSAVRVQLEGDLVGRDVLVLHGKLVPVETEGTYPDTGAHVDLAGESSMANKTGMLAEHTRMG